MSCFLRLFSVVPPLSNAAAALQSRIILRWLRYNYCSLEPKKKAPLSGFAALSCHYFCSKCQVPFRMVWENNMMTGCHRWQLRGIICYGCWIISIDVRSLEYYGVGSCRWHGCYVVVLCRHCALCAVVNGSNWLKTCPFWCSNNNVTVTSVLPVTAGNFPGMGSAFKNHHKYN